MQRKTKYGNILLFSIPSTLKTGHFNDYFIQNSSSLYLFLLPLTTQPPKVTLFHYKNGQKHTEKEFFLYKGNSKFLRYLFFYIYYLYVVLGVLPKGSIVMATTPQYCLFWRLFDLLKSIKVVYHVGDYYPGQQSRVMKIYQGLINFFNKRMKYVVYCSPLLESILKTGKEKKNGNRDYWVFGIKKRALNRRPKKNLMGYIGVLRDGQGLDIIIQTLIQNKNLHLEIMGDGPLLKNLKQTVSRLKLGNRIKFLGLIQDEKKIVSTVNNWEIGLAPYDPRLNNMTVYGDPSKIKFYLEYKLPVIMTKITYMHKEIEKFHAGLTIDFSSQSLHTAIREIQKRYNYYVKGVEKLNDKYEYNSLYEKQFKFFEKLR